MSQERATYAGAGVDIGAYTRMLEQVRPMIEATQGAGVVTGVGPFAGLFELPGGGGFLAASADGVGTKIKVAVAANDHSGIGVDLVNHCVNDIATAGARPLFFLDYFASGKLDTDVFHQVISGLTQACTDNSCALLGGETAELPGVYGPGDYDLAGFVVGFVEPDRRVEPVRAGDRLVGLPSSGLHSNGFSLVRQIFAQVSLEHVYPELARPLKEELLVPHRSYLKELQALSWKTAAHITGGGILDNLPRALPPGLAAQIDLSSWTVPPIFKLIQDLGQVGQEEMFRTFNMGLGMILVTDQVPSGFSVVGRVVEADDRPRIRLG